MPLTLRLKSEPTVAVEVDALRRESVRALSAADVARITVQYGREQVPCGELFDVIGSAADDNIIWEGATSKIVRIGQGLTGGKVRVEGDAGMHLGAEMTGGEILVTGNAGDWLGAHLRGGVIHVRGQAGDNAGAAYPGERRGLNGGEILIEGDAGHSAGARMRRGLLAIGGNAGDALGAGAIAGTIVLFGEPGRNIGAGLKRGSIALLGANSSPKLLPSFRESWTASPLFLQLVLRHLRSRGFPVPPDAFGAPLRCFRGDFLELGKGEIFCRAP